MTVKPVGGSAHGWSGSRALPRVLIAVSLMMAVGVAMLLPTPAANAERIVGTEGDYHIVGTAQRDRVRALGGDDAVSTRSSLDHVAGGSGDDTIRLGFSDPEEFAAGGGGNDTISGGMGPDVIDGGAGRDELHGDSGADSLVLGDGADSAFGGAGNDNVDIAPDGRPDQIACGPGNDFVIWSGRREMRDQLTGCEHKAVK